MDKSPYLFRQPENLACPIWRYLTLKKLEYLLREKKLYLPLATEFDDHHEGAINPHQIVWELQNDSGDPRSRTAVRRAQPQCTYISCWSCSEHESEALWGLYCGKKQGVVVRSTYAKLAGLVGVNSLLDLAVGLVDYDDRPVPPITFASFFRKRKSFAYEMEARLVASLYRCSDIRDEQGKLLTLKKALEKRIDLNTFVDEIRIHPKASKPFTKKIETLIDECAPELKPRLFPSEMSRMPEY